jgi:hypothetical protein
VLTSGDGPLFEATRDSAVLAVYKAQPYDMFSLTTYDQWKEIDINFDPREVVASEPSEIPSSAPAQAPPEDRAFYTEYLPTVLPGLDCEKPLLNTLRLGVRWKRVKVCTKQIILLNSLANERPCSSNARLRIFWCKAISNGCRMLPTGGQRASSHLVKKAN